MGKRKNLSDAGGSRAVFLVARVVVGFVAVLLLVLGAGFCWATFAGEIGWSGAALGLFMVIGGLWFGWSAMRPHRENVANMSVEFVAKVIAELF